MKRKLFRRNYLAVSVEGGLYMGGLTFLSAETVLPVIVKSLEGPSWIVSLSPVLSPLGFLLPSILTTHWVERMREVKPFLMVIGFFQRLPYLLAALALFWIGEDRPLVTLAIVVAAPFISGLMGGITLSAFFELLARVIPEERRASNLAIRFILSGLIGIGAGLVVQYTLENYPGTTGYGILHLIAFGLMMFSYLIFSRIREINRTPSAARPSRSLIEYLKSLPQFVRTDPYLLKFIWLRSTGVGFLVMIPFLGLHAVEITESNESLVGLLVTFQMIGGLCGNVTAGVLGDRIGARLPLFLSKASFLLMALAVLANESVYGFYAIYFLFGFGFFANHVSVSTLMTELAPKERRPAFMAVTAFITVPSLLISTGLGAWIHESTGSIIPAVWVTLGLLAVSLYFLSTIPEPRKQRPRKAGG